MLTEARTSKPFIRTATEADVHELGNTMRLEDVAEVWFSAHVSPLEALKRSRSASFETRAVEWQGRVVALFGVSPSMGGGCPWMLASDDLTAIRKSFLRGCHQVVDGWLKKHGRLANSVWAENHTHIQWLKWLGFTFNGESVRNGQTFLHFHKEHHV